MGAKQAYFSFAARSGPPAVAVRTSIAAAEAIADFAPNLRGKVFAFVGKRPTGATRQEISDQLGMKLQTVCARVNELMKMGLVYQSDEARDGRKVLRVANSKHGGRHAGVES